VTRTDNLPVAPVDPEDLTVTEQRWQTIKKKSTIGYAAVDLREQRMAFGKWNARDIDDTKLRSLIDGLVEGVYASRREAAFMVAVEKSEWKMDNSKKSPVEAPETMLVSQLPRITLTTEVEAYGGQHRERATAILRDRWTDEKLAIEKKVSRSDFAYVDRGH
jgi:hypothetical protein